MPAMWTALIRDVSPTLGACELTHLEREPIDVERAQAQHRGYRLALEELGCEVLELEPLPDQPDAVFVEDTAIVLDELAVLTRPGAASRRPESESVADVLDAFRPIVRLEAPATLDGGDVVQIGRRLYVGRSGRSNAAGLEQLQALVGGRGYEVRGVDVTGCLHLKSAVTAVSDSAVLLNPAWVDADAFADHARIEVDPGEPFAANVVRVGSRVLHTEGFPCTRARLEAHGLDVLSVDVSELAKAEGALTCCSLLVQG